MASKKQLKLITVPGQYEGYLLDDLKEFLGERFQSFTRWFRGSTGAIHDGKLLVYKWDYDAWRQGEPNYDW